MLLPEFMSRSSEEVAAQEFGATLALCGDHVTGRTPGTSGHGYPGDGRFCRASADI